MTASLVALLLAGACLVLACCGCNYPPSRTRLDAGVVPANTRTVHVGSDGCTVIVVDRADGTEQDLCLSASDLQPILDARAKAGRQ